MNYLTPEQVLFINARLIAETGGETGLLDLGLLESAVARPSASFEVGDGPYLRNNSSIHFFLFFPLVHIETGT